VYGKEGYCEPVGDHMIASSRNDSTGTEKMPLFRSHLITRELNSLWREWDGLLKIIWDSVFSDRKRQAEEIVRYAELKFAFSRFYKMRGKFFEE
jgi:hypothetical protein